VLGQTLCRKYPTPVNTGGGVWCAYAGLGIYLLVILWL
jgi:hypothetical protein